MILSEVEFNKLNTVDILCSKHSKSEKAIMKKCSLYPIDVITGETSLKGFYIEVVSYDCFTDYVVWNDCGNGIAIKYLTLREEQDIAEVAEIMRRNIKYKGAEGFKNYLSQRESNGTYINLAEIQVLELIGEAKLADHYGRYREDYLTRYEQKKQEQEKQRQIEQQKLAEERRREFDAKIAKAEDCIRENKLLKNDLLDNEKHLILYLLKKHDINVPLKTQGWINNKLDSVVFTQNGEITVYFYKSKGGKCPQSIYKYLGLLKAAVNKTDYPVRQNDL